jgi:uncharacterized protein YhdP
VVGVRDKHLQVQLASNLNGLALTCLRRWQDRRAGHAAALRPATVDRAGRAGLDEVTVQLGNAASARYVLRRGGDALEVVAGGIGVGQSAPQPASGVTVAMTTETGSMSMPGAPCSAARITKAATNPPVT